MQSEWKKTLYVTLTLSDGRDMPACEVELILEQKCRFG